MRCDEMPEKLVSLLYGELDKKEADTVRSHMKTCGGCKEVFQEMKSTQNLLVKWEDAPPKTHFVFVSQPAGRLETWKEKIGQFSRSRGLALGIPLLTVICLAFLSISKFQIHHKNGELQLGFGIEKSTLNEDQNKLLVDALKQIQTETLTLVSGMIQDSEEHQRRENTLILTQFARDLETRRQTDLRMMGQGLQGLQLVTEDRYIKTRSVIDDLVRMASYKVEQKN